MDIVGTWKLVSITREEIPSGVKTDLMGPDPIGFINYAPDGRMMIVAVGRDRQAPKSVRATPNEADALFRSMIAYAGTYRVEGSKVIHQVDASWNETWTGTTHTRDVTIEGNRIYLRSGPNPDPQDGKLSIRTMVWERLSGQE